MAQRFEPSQRLEELSAAALATPRGPTLTYRRQLTVDGKSSSKSSKHCSPLHRPGRPAPENCHRITTPNHSTTIVAVRREAPSSVVSPARNTTLRRAASSKKTRYRPLAALLALSAEPCGGVGDTPKAPMRQRLSCSTDSDGPPAMCALVSGHRADGLRRPVTSPASPSGGIYRTRSDPA
jgi:hypothetical protein